MIVIGIVMFYVVPALLLTEIMRYVYLEHRGDRIPILLYHRIVSREDVAAGRVPDTEPIYASYDDRFAAQMKFVKDSGFTTLNLDEYLAIRQARRPLPVKPVVLTFDDGYSSNYTLAFPVLRRLGLTATIFVAPQPDEYTRRRVAGIDGFLSADQMRELDGSGVAIESHTLTHCILSELDDAAARHELAESKRVLGRILGRPIRHLAVPRSGHSRRIRELAREEGYLTVCSNGKGTSNGWSDLLSLPRIVIERDMTVEDFRRALQPRTAVILRLVGNLKRAPALVLGATRTQALRRMLYGSPLGPLFITNRLVRGLFGVAILYAVGIVLFTWYMATRP